MEKDEKIEERKKYNEPFLKVFDYLAKEKKMNQGQFAKVIDSESGYISLLKSGFKRVGPEYIARISAEFAKHFDDEQHLNPDFIEGKSPYMIIENVPDDEIIEKIGRGANPDYDLIQHRKKKEQQKPIMSTFDTSILIEKAVEKAMSYADKTIASLEAQVAEKEKYIKLLELRVTELEATQQFQEGQEIIRKHPFPVGVAEQPISESDKMNV